MNIRQNKWNGSYTEGIIADMRWRLWCKSGEPDFKVWLRKQPKGKTLVAELARLKALIDTDPA